MIRHRAISVNREIALCSSTLQASHNPLPNRLIQKSCVSFVGTQSKKIQLLTDIPRGIKPDSLARQRHAARLPQPSPPCVAPGFSPALFPVGVLRMRRAVDVPPPAAQAPGNPGTKPGDRRDVFQFFQSGKPGGRRGQTGSFPRFSSAKTVSPNLHYPGRWSTLSPPRRFETRISHK